MGNFIVAAFLFYLKKDFKEIETYEQVRINQMY